MIIVAGDSNHHPKYSDYTKNNISVWTDMLDIEVDNVSKSGVGNDFICDAVLRSIQQKQIDHVYVFWSEWYRVLKTPNKESQEWLQTISDEEFKQIANLNINLFYSLQSALKQMNLNYTFYQDLWPWPHMKIDKMFEAAKFIMQHPLYDLIDKDRFWGWPIHPDLGGRCLSNLQHDQLSDTNSHYGQKTHDFFAKNIIDKGMSL